MKVIRKTLELIPEYDIGSICSLQEMLLFDIETTGLRKETTQAYLIGCVYWQEGAWHTIQWLTENTSDEALILEDFLEFASSFRVLVHFNGDRFDIPYLEYKCDYYRTVRDLKGFESFDIYKEAKQARRLLGLSSMSQKSIEQYIGIDRDDLMDGGLLIPVYYEYEKTGAPEPERLLLLHNFDDLQGMLRILPILSYKEVFHKAYEFLEVREQEDSLLLNYRLNHPVPVPCEAVLPSCTEGKERVSLNGDLLQIHLHIYEGTGRVPLENVSDYYYLPEEDTVIHKDVAMFLDRSRRVKATKKNCFLKKQGRFVLQPAGLFTPAFQLPEDKKRVYADADDLLHCADSGMFLRLADDLLQSISCH